MTRPERRRDCAAKPWMTPTASVTAAVRIAIPLTDDEPPLDEEARVPPAGRFASALGASSLAGMNYSWLRVGIALLILGMLAVVVMVVGGGHVPRAH